MRPMTFPRFSPDWVCSPSIFFSSLMIPLHHPDKFFISYHVLQDALCFQICLPFHYHIILLSVTPMIQEIRIALAVFVHSAKNCGAPTT